MDLICEILEVVQNLTMFLLYTKAEVQHTEPPLKINVKESTVAYGQYSGDQVVACRNQIENIPFFCPLEVLLHGCSWIYTVFNKTLVAIRDLNM